MNKWFLFLFLFAFAFLLSGQTSVEAEEIEYEKIIIDFKGNVDYEYLKSIEAKEITYLENLDLVIAEVPKKDVGVLAIHPSIEHIEKDKVVKIAETKTKSTVTPLAQEKDWGIDRVGIPFAWELGVKGTGVKVAVFDTGIEYYHSDLKNPDETSAVRGGVSFVTETNGDTSYDDYHGHGTHVAGIIGARDNTIGVIGVAPKSDLYAVKVFDASGNGSTTTIISGIDWAIENNMHIINLSLGTQGNDLMLQEAIKKAYDRGIIIVSAAGNDFGESTYDGGCELTTEINCVDFPAKYEQAIAVAAITNTDEHADYSSVGTEVEIAAPGSNIKSTLIGDSYGIMSGTSMATPYVAGQFALLKEKYPTLTNIELRNKLISLTEDLGETGRDKVFGYGVPVIEFEPTFDDGYFNVEKENTGVYVSKDGVLVLIGMLKVGEEYKRLSDYGNWHQVQFGNQTGFVYKGATTPSFGDNIHNEANQPNSEIKIIPKANEHVYDNSSGSLVPFATLEKDKEYNVIGKYGNWYMLNVLGRTGYIHQTKIIVKKEFDTYFTPSENAVGVYDNSNGTLVKVGELVYGQEYERVGAMGSWHKIKFANSIAYVYSGSTYPSEGISIKNKTTETNKKNYIQTFYGDVNVYDNTSGSLVKFATLKAEIEYPIISSFGNWVKTDVYGRTGYIYKPSIEMGFQEGDVYFEPYFDGVKVYQEQREDSKIIGQLKIDQEYLRIGEIGEWNKVIIGDEIGYVKRNQNKPTSGETIGKRAKEIKDLVRIKLNEEKVIYDNSTGSLVPFGTLSAGEYQIVSQFGNWYEINYAGRLGYIYHSNTEVMFKNVVEPKQTYTYKEMESDIQELKKVYP